MLGVQQYSNALVHQVCGSMRAWVLVLSLRWEAGLFFSLSNLVRDVRIVHRSTGCVLTHADLCAEPRLLLLVLGLKQDAVCVLFLSLG